MDSSKCPLCGITTTCQKLSEGRNGYIQYHCETYKVNFSLSDDIINLQEGNEEREKLLNLVVEQLLHMPYCMINGEKEIWHFYYKQSYYPSYLEQKNYINLGDRIKNYPSWPMDLVDRVLLNLSYAFPDYGEMFYLSYQERKIAFELGNNQLVHFGILRIASDLGYLRPYKEHSNNYIITADGWKRIESLRKNEMVLKQGFIAMKFGDETKFIREAFRQAIRESGYSERFIDEKEHNNQIVPEILFEISRSKFMVVDITFPNYGAYYEAGYGQALGKEVIICCRKEEFDSLEKKPHFDIAQKSMIVWIDTDDLIERLKRRIEATVTN